VTPSRIEGKIMRISIRVQTIGSLFIIALFILSVSSAPAAEIMIVGHRGAAGLMPENTLSGFRKAIEIGVDAIELDVHLTADNVMVVTHDYRLNSALTRDPQGRWIKKRPLIKDLTLAQVQAYDVGRLKDTSKYARKYPIRRDIDGEYIPTLREVIKLLKKANEKTVLIIEIKTSPVKSRISNSPKLVAGAVTKILNEEGFADRARVISFDWRSLGYIREIMPGVLTGHLTSASNRFDTIQKNKPGASPWLAGIDIDDYDSIPQAIKAVGGQCWVSNHAHANVNGRGMTSMLVQQANDLGLDVYVWTLNREPDMHRMIEGNVDGIITDRPDLLKSILTR
jgi:glycerophosphoryl diester phosphodiesterase